MTNGEMVEEIIRVLWAVLLTKLAEAHHRFKVWWEDIDWWTVCLGVFVCVFIAFIIVWGITESRAMNECVDAGFAEARRRGGFQYECVGVRDGQSIVVPLAEIRNRGE